MSPAAPRDLPAAAERAKALGRTEGRVAAGTAYSVLSELYLTGDDLLFEYDGGLISDCLAGLNANEVNVFVMAKEFREECKLTEPWFKTRYTVEDISEERRKRWADPEVIEEFHLPEPNVFIAEGRAT